MINLKNLHKIKSFEIGHRYGIFDISSVFGNKIMIPEVPQLIEHNKESIWCMKIYVPIKNNFSGHGFFCNIEKRKIEFRVRVEYEDYGVIESRCFKMKTKLGQTNDRIHLEFLKFFMESKSADMMIQNNKNRIADINEYLEIII